MRCGSSFQMKTINCSSRWAVQAVQAVQLFGLFVPPQSLRLRDGKKPDNFLVNLDSWSCAVGNGSKLFK